MQPRTNESQQILFDAIVIGSGAIGISTAYHLAKEKIKVAIIEKESGPAMHQSGRNSGVIHAGYNLKPGSLKAQYCVKGNQELREYCQEKGVPIKEDGILIIAQTESDTTVINELEKRGIANKTPVKILGQDEIKYVEPRVRGIQALQAINGASIDSYSYVKSLANDTSSLGAKIFYNNKVLSIKEQGNIVTTKTEKGIFLSKVVINAAGLYADELADDIADDIRIIPFRGYYAELIPQLTHMVNSHVYATPDLNFPFLGIHLSKRTDGRVIVGPGAMLAFGREAYTFGSFKGGRLSKTLGWPGFYKMMARPEFQKLLQQEIKKSILIKAIAKEAIQLIPELTENSFIRSYAGNRAQLVDRNGNLIDDILVRETSQSIHVLNAVSPGLTCSLPFGRYLAHQAINKL